MDEPTHAHRRDSRGRKSRQDIYRNVAEALNDLRQMGGLPSPVNAADIWGDIWYAEAHNSTAIEGNTLAFKEVKLLLSEGVAVGNKQLGDYLEVKGYGEAARWVYNQALEPAWTTSPPALLLTLSEVREVHRLLMEPVWHVRPPVEATPLETPGNFRHHNIRAFPGGMKPPDWTELDVRMRDWVDKLCRGPGNTRPVIEEIADWFAEFERIHPFLDGNGRAGRLLTNLVLIRLGYPPVVIYKRQRQRYLAALRRADRGDPGLFGEFLARAVLDALYRFIIPAMATADRLVPLAALADETLSQLALRQAAERGRLKAQRDDSGQWLSMLQWVDDYKRQRYKRQPQLYGRMGGSILAQGDLVTSSDTRWEAAE